MDSVTRLEIIQQNIEPLWHNQSKFLRAAGCSAWFVFKLFRVSLVVFSLGLFCPGDGGLSVLFPQMVMQK